MMTGYLTTMGVGTELTIQHMPSHTRPWNGFVYLSQNSDDTHRFSLFTTVSLQRTVPLGINAQDFTETESCVTNIYDTNVIFCRSGLLIFKLIRYSDFTRPKAVPPAVK